MLYGHVFRNAMLIVIAGFPGAFIGILFTGALLIEVIFSLDGLGLLGFEAAINRDYPVMFGTLYFFTLLGLLLEADRRPDLHAGRSAHRFREPGGLMARRPPRRCRACSASASDSARSTAPLLAAFAATAAATGRSGSFSCCFVVSLFAEFIANDKPAGRALRRRLLHPRLRRLSRDRVRRRLRDRGRLPRPVRARS